MKLPADIKEQFRKAGAMGGRKGSATLTATERKQRARQAGIASGKARKKKAQDK